MTLEERRPIASSSALAASGTPRHHRSADRGTLASRRTAWRAVIPEIIHASVQVHAGSESSPMAVLKYVTGDLAGTLVDLKRDVTVIGRLPECDIILTPVGVSRRHA